MLSKTQPFMLSGETSVFFLYHDVSFVRHPVLPSRFFRKLGYFQFPWVEVTPKKWYLSPEVWILPREPRQGLWLYQRTPPKHDLWLETWSGKAWYLFPDEQRDGRNPICVLVAFGDRHLLQELHFLLTGQKNDLSLTKHHYGVGELVTKQPRLPERKREEDYRAARM